MRPRERLPLQERLEREDGGARLRMAANEPRDLGYPRVTSPYALASMPFVDQTFSAEATRNDSSRHYQGDYTAYLTGDFLGMEGSAYLSTRTQKTVLPSDDRTPSLNSVAGVIDDRTGSEVRLTLARHDPDANLLGPMRARSVELGSFVLPSVPNVLLASPHGNGVMVSNRPLDQPTSFDRHTFRGNLPPGWDVTLYYNDALIAYQTPRSDGQYAFEDLPLSFGPNEFRLVFNGPLGQVRVERQSFLLDQSVIAPGEFFYSLAQHRADGGDERTVAQIDYGITRALSVNGAFVRKPRLNGGEDSNYAQGGARAYLDSMILSALVTEQLGSGTLTELAVKTGLGGYALDFVHQQRQGSFESDVLINAPAGLRYRDKVRANGVTRIDALPPLTIAVEATRDAVADGHDRIDLAGRVSTIYRGTAITNSLAWTRADGIDITDGMLQLSRRVVDIGLTAQVGYGLAPRLELQSATLTADRALGDAYRLTAGVQRTMISPLTTVTAGLTKNLGAFGLGLNGSYSSKHELTLGLQLFIAIGREPRSGAWLVDAQPLAGTGAISARAFVDRNHERRSRRRRGARRRRRLHPQRRRPASEPHRRAMAPPSSAACRPASTPTSRSTRQRSRIRNGSRRRPGCASCRVPASSRCSSSRWWRRRKSTARSTSPVRPSGAASATLRSSLPTKRAVSSPRRAARPTATTCCTRCCRAAIRCASRPNRPSGCSCREAWRGR